MPKTLDLAGVRFGRLLAVRCVGTNKNRQRVWLCRCDCGRQTRVTTNNLRTGNTKSCGCGQIEAGCRNLLTSARRQGIVGSPPAAAYLPGHLASNRLVAGRWRPS